MNMPESMSQPTFSFLENTKGTAVHNAIFVGQAIDHQYQLASRLEIPSEYYKYAMLVLGYELEKREFQENREMLKEKLENGSARFKNINIFLTEINVVRGKVLPIIKAKIDEMIPADGDKALGIIPLAFHDLVTEQSAFRRNFWSADKKFRPSEELLKAWTGKWQEKLSRKFKDL